MTTVSTFIIIALLIAILVVLVGKGDKNVKHQIGLLVFGLLAIVVVALFYSLLAYYRS